MVVHNIKSFAEFREKVANSTSPVAVFCWAAWNDPSNHVSPTIHEHSAKYPGVTFYAVDIDKAHSIVTELEVRTVPAVYFFKNGTNVSKVVGPNPPAIEDAIKSIL